MEENGGEWRGMEENGGEWRRMEDGRDTPAHLGVKQTRDIHHIVHISSLFTHPGWIQVPSTEMLATNTANFFQFICMWRRITGLSQPGRAGKAGRGGAGGAAHLFHIAPDCVFATGRPWLAIFRFFRHFDAGLETMAVALLSPSPKRIRNGLNFLAFFSRNFNALKMEMKMADSI